MLNQWFLESRGYTVLILVCVCPGKGSITLGKYRVKSFLLLSGAAKSKEIRTSKVSQCNGVFHQIFLKTQTLAFCYHFLSL